MPIGLCIIKLYTGSDQQNECNLLISMERDLQNLC